jgi:hypothetical protein
MGKKPLIQGTGVLKLETRKLRKPHSQETKNKMSETRKGVPRSEKSERKYVKPNQEYHVLKKPKRKNK